MKTKKILSAVLVIAGMILSAGGPSPKECFEQAQKSEAVRRVYPGGVPHTDRTGNRRTSYDPEKSFFPIGMWGVPVHTPGGEYDWNKLRDLHINTVWPYGSSAKPWRKILDLAGSFGFQVIFMGALPEKGMAEIAGHPNLLGNVWMDEPTGRLEEPGRMDRLMGEFLKYKTKANAAVPSMAVFVNNAPWIQPPATEWFVKWNNSGDVACQDNYPILLSPANTHTLAKAPQGLVQTVLMSALSNPEPKPVWFVAGTFDQAPHGKNDPFPFRFATPKQLRAQIYAAIVHGATGIHYFIWDSYISREASIYGISPSPRRIPQTPLKVCPPASAVRRAGMRSLWETASAVNQELEKLTPSLLSPDFSAAELSWSLYACPVSGMFITENPVRAMLKKVPGAPLEAMLISVNLDAASFDAVFRFDREISEGEILFDSSHVPLELDRDRRGFMLRYDPFDSHEIRLKFVENSKIVPVGSGIPEIIPMPVSSATLHKVGAVAARRLDNIVTQRSVISQPIVKGKTAWSVQWNKCIYPGAKEGLEYDFYIRAAIDNSASGPLFHAGWWKTDEKREIVGRTVKSSEFIPGEYTWIKIGAFPFPKNSERCVPYVAPSKDSDSSGYRIESAELRRSQTKMRP